MATLRDEQDLRAADGAFAERMTYARECREAAQYRFRERFQHVIECPLGEDCEARA